MDQRIPCVIMRGGTSKCVVFSASDLPTDPTMRDRAILEAFGSPDKRQIDGLGGADPLTSKLAIVARSEHDDADVDYTFGQVGIITESINYAVNCGNTAAAVGVYALQEGLAKIQRGVSSVRIHSTNSGKIVVAEVPTADGTVETHGTFEIAGVPRPGPGIAMRFLDPAGGVTGKLLPTGAATDFVELEGGRTFEFSLVDCGNLYAIFRAGAWSLDGTETPEDLDANTAFRTDIEALRQAICARYLKIDADSGGAGVKVSGLKVAIVGPAKAYLTSDGSQIPADAIDFSARIINQERVHKAFAVTGAICLAAAAAVRGTIVNELCTVRDGSPAEIRIGHPQGLISPLIESSCSDSGLYVEAVQVRRTARRIMDGFVYVSSRLPMP